LAGVQLELLSDLKKENCAQPFLDPVRKAVAPDYYDIVENPIDISAMAKKCREHVRQMKEDGRRQWR
jgi:hypothetical protein